MYFVYGSSSQITVTGYSEENKTITVNTGSGETPMEINSTKISSQDFIMILSHTTSIQVQNTSSKA